MPAKRKRSAVTRLLAKREVVGDKAARLAARIAVARAAHDPRLAHPERGVLDPWKADCVDCRRVQKLMALLGRPRFVRHDELVLIRRMVDEAERTHKARLAGQQKTAAIRRTKPSAMVKKVLVFCRDHNLLPKKRGNSKIISDALGAPLRSVQRALKAINSR